MADDLDRAIREKAHEIHVERSTLQEFIDFVRSTDAGGFGVDKVMFCNALKFCMFKYDPDNAKKAYSGDSIAVKKDSAAKTTAASAAKTTTSPTSGVKPTINVMGVNNKATSNLKL